MFKHFVIIIIFTFLSHIALIASEFLITDYGAKSTEGYDNTFAIQAAIDNCSKNGGGTIIFPPGDWASGTVFLKSNINIYLSPGCIWRALNDNDAFPYIEPKIMSRESEQARRSLIYAHRKENIKIYGEGKISGGGEYDIFHHSIPNQYYARPYGIFMVSCKSITISGLYMEKSAFWMQRYFNCDSVTLTNLNIFNHVNRNNDGIDIDGCHNVIVDNCRIDSSDDALVIKSEGLRTAEDIVINNCILSSHATALKCGTGSVGGYKRISISNVIIRPSSAKEMHHVLKAWGGISGIDLLNVDGGIMEDITISNVQISGVETPVFIKTGRRNSTWEGKPETTVGITRNISLNNISAVDCGTVGNIIDGYEDHPVENVRLNNIYLRIKGSGEPNDTMSFVKPMEDSYPYNRMYGRNMPSYGFYIRNANDVFLNDIVLETEGVDYRPALSIVKSDNVFLNNTYIHMNERADSHVHIQQSENVHIHSPVKSSGIKGNKSQWQFYK